MTLQFRQKKSASQLQQLEKEVTLLRDYNKALESENQSRNQERKVLHAQIDRLLAIQQLWKIARSSVDVNVNIIQTKQYTQINQLYIQIKDKYQTLLKDQQRLLEQNKNQYIQLNPQNLAKVQRQKQALELANNNYQSKIFNLEDKISKLEIQISQYRKEELGSSMITKQLFSFQVKIDQFQRQLENKSKQLLIYQNEALSKEDKLKRQINLKQQKIQYLEKELKINRQQLRNKVLQSTENDSLIKQITKYQFKNSQLERLLSQSKILQQTISLQNQEIRRLSETSKNDIILKEKRIDELEKELRLKNEEIVCVKGAGITQVDELIKQITNYKFKNSQLERQLSLKQQIQRSLQIKDQQIRRLSYYQTNSSQLQNQILFLKNTNEQQKIFLNNKNQQLELKIIQFSENIKNKNNEISTIQILSLAKDEQLASLKLQINLQKDKVTSLNEQIEKLEKSLKTRSHVQTIKYIESEEAVILRSKIEQMHLSNKSIQDNLKILSQQNHIKINIIRDLQRRIEILQDTNRNLERELRITIDNHKANSSVMQERNQQEQQLKEIIFNLKEELHEIRNFNQLLRKENQQLQIQLYNFRTHNHQCRHHQHRDKSRSRSPQPHHRKTNDKWKVSKYSELTFRQDEPFNSHQGTQMVKTSPLNPALYKGNASSSLTKDRYDDLQRKIRHLQAENESLKQHLV